MHELKKLQWKTSLCFPNLGAFIILIDHVYRLHFYTMYCYATKVIFFSSTLEWDYAIVCFLCSSQLKMEAGNEDHHVRRGQYKQYLMNVSVPLSRSSKNSLKRFCPGLTSEQLQRDTVGIQCVLKTQCPLTYIKWSVNTL